MDLRHFPDFPSKIVPPRQVDVWLPPRFDPASPKRYPVIYMHDGQNLFEPEHAFIGVDWGIDLALNQLIKEEAVQPPIVVGIWNTSNRLGEYMPQKAFHNPEGLHYLTITLPARYPDHQINPMGDTYLSFLIEELKPWVDATFPTLPEPRHTHIMGSSMGGLISLYALCQYPHIFNGAACLSNAWNIGEHHLLDFFIPHLPTPQAHKLYLDMGGIETDEPALNAFLLESQVSMQQGAIQASFQEGKSLRTLVFDAHIHSEKDWRRRVHIPLQFLLSHS